METKRLKESLLKSILNVRVIVIGINNFQQNACNFMVEILNILKTIKCNKKITKNEVERTRNADDAKAFRTSEIDRSLIDSTKLMKTEFLS